jgi:hypothetical protein
MWQKELLQPISWYELALYQLDDATVRTWGWLLQRKALKK